MDRVQGLERGADDYMTKPFHPEELLARVKSIMRRVYPKHEAQLITIGDVILSDAERSITLDGTRLEVTGAEFGLLKLLLGNPGDPISREELIPRIFDREPTRFDRSIDNLVNNLRRKLGPHRDGVERIKSVRNVGYCYVLPNEFAGSV